MKLYTDLSAAAQAAFARPDVAARDAELHRSVANLGGGFTKKRSHGKTYWYYQWKMPDGVARQIFVGPDDSPTRDLMARHSSPEKMLELAALLKLTRAALEYGCPDIPIKHGRIIGRLLDHGFFKAGGILVGTHAFLAYQNMFGIRWNSGAYTLDIDFADAGRKLSLAIASNVVMDTAKAIDSLEMGFIPVASKTTFKKPDEPDLDLVKESWLDVTSRGPGWQQRMNAGWNSLTRTFPDQNFQERLAA